jgi:hypothetical protein
MKNFIQKIRDKFSSGKRKVAAVVASVVPAAAVMSPLSASAATTTPTDGTIDFSGIISIITNAAGSLLPAVVSVIGVSVGVGLVIWGFPKLLSIFKRSAK